MFCFSGFFCYFILIFNGKIRIIRWGELESGQTTIAFTPLHQHETDDLTGTVQTRESGRDRAPIEVCFVYSDVDAAYKVMIIVSQYSQSLLRLHCMCSLVTDGVMCCENGGLSESGGERCGAGE